MTEPIWMEPWVLLGLALWAGVSLPFGMFLGDIGGTVTLSVTQELANDE